MADETAIETMRQELETNGYSEDSAFNWHWRGGNNGAYSATFPSIDSAYRHYEEGQSLAELERENAAMKALLEEIAGMPYDSSQRRLMERAWDILGMEYEGED